MAFVFISHAPADRQRIEPFLQHVKARGHRLWVDSEGLSAGPEQRATLLAGLAQADAALALLSAESLALAQANRQVHRDLLPGMPDAQLEAAVAEVRPKAAAAQALAQVAAQRSAGWSLYEALTAHAAGRLALVVIDADFPSAALPAPLALLPTLEIPLYRTQEGLQGPALRASAKERAFARLDRLLAKAARRRRSQAFEPSLAGLGRLLSGAPEPAPSWPAPAAAGAGVAALGFAAALAAAPGFSGAGGAMLAQQVDGLAAQLSTVQLQTQRLGGVNDRQGALLFALTADLRHPETCRRGAALTAPLELEANSVVLQRGAAPVEGMAFLEGDGLYQVARRAYGPAPYRVSNLLFFANLDYFCADDRPPQAEAGWIGPEKTSLRAPRLGQVLQGLLLPAQAGPRAAQAEEAGGEGGSP